MDSHYLIVIVVVFALLFDFANGWNDSANAIATVVSTRVLSPLRAVVLAALLNLIGAYLSTRVAKTIGGGIVEPAMVTQTVVLFAMVAATFWVTWATWRGLPISASHSLIGGLLGAAIGNGGLSVIQWKGLATVVTALFVSPLLGGLVGFLSMRFLGKMMANVPSGKVNRIFGKLQLVSCGLMALSHGTNDAQKVMGIITLALFSGGYLKNIEVPFWVITLCAIAMASGTATGGWKVVKTLGSSLMHLRPVHGFAAETSATAVLFSAAVLGVPVSTTHVITSSIIGVGAESRMGAVRWSIGKKIAYAWVWTFPFCIFCGYFLVKLFHRLST